MSNEKNILAGITQDQLAAIAQLLAGSTPAITTPTVPSSIKVSIGDIGNLVANEKTFSTGSQGYSVCGKITDGTHKYQVTCNIVRIGSNPNKAKPAKPAKPAKAA